jgi:hypothetical protein
MLEESVRSFLSQMWLMVFGAAFLILRMGA